MLHLSNLHHPCQDLIPLCLCLHLHFLLLVYIHTSLLRRFDTSLHPRKYRKNKRSKTRSSYLHRNLATLPPLNHSQLSQTQYSLMVESGLGLENMTGAEISALLDDDGIEAELDLGASHSKEQTGRDEEILFSQGDLVIFENTQPTTIGMNNTRASGSRSFQPLFDD
ncbi:hypothetical protein DL96DRAFT_1169683 [Flagelloscypha sp. PMI_526]|nr:hypothetical protein DL96DRAFT_1169683 [Flagelloscypha sp. PMI_526]